ncbi:hypothetical protein BB560_002252 [Smittium megazygosporum]|uniref:Cytochrome c oxidase subunit IV n=1 Tax=Smittium megazygosporum TaxID=133381 RepID=A0A2T9ZF92_9FUNG|nr:hypothetical protein BB560_002252 [Smittium megazygosporum]
MLRSSRVISLGAQTLRMQLRRSTTAASSAPVISQVEAKWAETPETSRAEIVAKLDELMKNDWHKLSTEDKRAAFYVHYGNYGPRAPISQKGDGLKIFLYTSAIVGLSLITTYAASVLIPRESRTLTKEWMEKSNEIALAEKANPITGISSEGYTGKGFVQ